MKQRSTTPVSAGLATKSTLVAAAVLMAVAAPLSMPSLVPTASARDYDAEISALQRQVDKYNKKAGQYGAKADSLQATLNRLANEKAAIQKQISLSQAKYDKLTKQIKETERKIATNKDALGEIIASLYVDGQASPLEMLASSKNIGDFVDKTAYQTSIQDRLSETIATIKKLKKDLEVKKRDVTRTLADQKNARAALVSKEQERQRLLKKTRNSEASYKKLSASANAQKLQVQQQQQAALEAAYSRGGGGGMVSGGGSLGSYASWAGNCYVDANAVSHGGARGNGQDPLGYGCNQCVSYTAWKMMQITGYGPSYWGNANMWPGSARAAGFKVTSQPRAKALGVMSAGAYGHIVYIESYNPSNNTVNISQYNEYLPGQGWGHYSTRSGVPASTYDTYIYL